MLKIFGKKKITLTCGCAIILSDPAEGYTRFICKCRAIQYERQGNDLVLFRGKSEHVLAWAYGSEPL